MIGKLALITFSLVRIAAILATLWSVLFIGSLFFCPSLLPYLGGRNP